MYILFYALNDDLVRFKKQNRIHIVPALLVMSFLVSSFVYPTNTGSILFVSEFGEGGSLPYDLALYDIPDLPYKFLVLVQE